MAADGPQRGARSWASRLTVRGRLTVLYALVFLCTGGVLLLLTYAAVRGSSSHSVAIAIPHPGPGQPVPSVIRNEVTRNVSSQRASDLGRLLLVSAIALSMMTLVSLAVGRFLAGRVLRPLRAMTATTQQISEESLDRRLVTAGPRDELRDLGETINGLLERLEVAFEAQRQFVANASHELRTPLTVSRALLEMILGDDHATVESLRETCRHVLEAGEEEEKLIDALLVLARSQRGLDHREAVDLALVTRRVLDARGDGPYAPGVDLTATLSAAPLLGDPQLVERLVANLLDNARRHNVSGGRVDIEVAARDGRASLTISNTGPVMPAEEVGRLLEPFRRVTRDRVGHAGGHGLGLSIVAAIARAHRANLDVRARPAGGLEVEVRFAALAGTPTAGTPTAGTPTAGTPTAGTPTAAAGLPPPV
jgi:signal transduction histidine kinase